jgi:hypothetical protein
VWAVLAAIFVGYGGCGETLCAAAAFDWVILVDSGVLYNSASKQYREHMRVCKTGQSC